MRDLATKLSERMAAMKEDERERIRRELTGEASTDQIIRGQVYDAIRTLRTSPASLASPDQYQRALSDVQRAVSAIISVEPRSPASRTS